VILLRSVKKFLASILVLTSFLFCSTSAFAGVSLSAFTDPELRGLVGGHDQGGKIVYYDDGSYANVPDGILDDDELRNITQLRIDDFPHPNEVALLNEIQLLPYIKSLQITNLTTSAVNLKMPNLEELDVTRNNLLTMDLSGCPNLTVLYCGANKLQALDLSKNSQLVFLECWDNDLEYLDLTNCRNLVFLSCTHNKLTKLDLSACKNSLKTLRVDANYLDELYLGEHKNLTELSVEYQKQSKTKLKVNRIYDYEKSLGKCLYQVNLKDFVSRIENIDPDNIYGGRIAPGYENAHLDYEYHSWYEEKPDYDPTTGIVTFTREPTYIQYTYNRSYSRKR